MTVQLSPSLRFIDNQQGIAVMAKKEAQRARLQLASNYLKVQQGKLRRDNFGGEEGDANGNQKLAINGTGDDESGSSRGRDKRTVNKKTPKRNCPVSFGLHHWR